MRLKGIEREFVKAHTAIIVSPATDLQKLAQLRRLEKDFSRRLANKARLKLELNRRIAETRLDLSISRGRSIAICRARFKALAKLGFTNLGNKAHWHLIYARTALEKGYDRAASELVNSMVRELRDSLLQRRSLIGRELLSHFEELQARL